MINITYIYLVENCYENPNKVYVGKTVNPKDRKVSHKKTFGRQIVYTIIDQINSIDPKEWKPLETKWIQHFINLGFDVQNKKKEGGSGSSKWTEEQRNNRKGKGTGPNLLISQKKINHPGYSRPVFQYDLYGNFIQEYPSVNEATRNNKGDIVACVMGKQKQAGGYQYFYKDIPHIPLNQYKRTRSDDGKKRCKTILQYDLEGNLIQEFESAAYAAKILGFLQPDISACCNGKIKTSRGFIWKFK